MLQTEIEQSCIFFGTKSVIATCTNTYFNFFITVLVFRIFQKNRPKIGDIADVTDWNRAIVYIFWHKVGNWYLHKHLFQFFYYSFSFSNFPKKSSENQGYPDVTDWNIASMYIFWHKVGNCYLHKHFSIFSLQF